MGRASLLFVTQVAPYHDGPAGVHGVLEQAAVGVSQVAELHGLQARRVDDVRVLDDDDITHARALALFTIGETPWSELHRYALRFAPRRFPNGEQRESARVRDVVVIEDAHVVNAARLQTVELRDLRYADGGLLEHSVHPGRPVVVGRDLRYEQQGRAPHLCARLERLPVFDDLPARTVEVALTARWALVGLRGVPVLDRAYRPVLHGTGVLVGRERQHRSQGRVEVL